jgi:uncharacterized membrane protein
MNRKSLAVVMGTMLTCWLAACKTPSHSETAHTQWEALSAEALRTSHGTIDFARHVKPVLEAKCVVCHNRQTLPFFSMENGTLAFKAGAAGPRIVPGHPEKSSLVHNATGAHSKTMPPVGERMTADEKRIITAWVAQGAQWPQGKAGELHPLNGTAH